MGSEWGRVTIAECAADEPYSTQIGPFGEKIRADIYTEDGAPVLRGTNVNPDGRFYDDDFVFISLELAEAEFGKFVCEADDVILCHKGTLGKIGIIPQNSRFKKYIMGNSMMKVRCNKKKLEPLYLYYWLCSREGQDYLFSRVSQVGVPQIQRPLTTLREATFPLPPLPEQHAIAHILGTLDDKIELNRRMSETLGAIARTLFKSWFVDFDPVRAKTEGRNSGLPKALADLFPARLVDSELGEIPEGWRVEPLEQHFEAIKGVSYKGNGLSDAGMPLHNLNSVYEGGGYKYEGIKYYKGEYTERHLVRPGDVIVANTEQGHDRLLIGYAAIVPHLFGDHGIASHHIYRMRPRKESKLTRRFLCTLLNSPTMHDLVSGYANGTTVNMLPIDGVQKPLILIPPDDLVSAFDKLAQNTLDRGEVVVGESRTLAALRDTLLPKLMTGEIRLKEHEN